MVLCARLAASVHCGSDRLDVVDAGLFPAEFSSCRSQGICMLILVVAVYRLY